MGRRATPTTTKDTYLDTAGGAAAAAAADKRISPQIGVSTIGLFVVVFACKKKESKQESVFYLPLRPLGVSCGRQPL